MSPRRLRRTLAALSLATVVAACGGQGGPDADDYRSGIADHLVEGDYGLDEAQAECVAEILVDEIGVDALKDLDVSDDEPTDGLAETIAAAVARAPDDCDVDAGTGG